jgi:negative regulator of flagellin synthesis FlgM
MKIGSIEIKPPVLPLAPERKKTDATGANGAAEASAQVDISAAGSLLSGAVSSGGTDPTFDAQKVEKIAQAIRDGKFQINPEAIADKLIDNAKELLSRKPS